MTTPQVAFVSATMALRPPRVAILIPDDDAWRDWAMLAIATASEYWGGGGFIFVPYSRETRKPSTHFADVVRAYDPDHVVTLQIPAQDLDALCPGAIRITKPDGETAEGEERAALIRNIHEQLDDPAARAAREVLASWCSPMRSTRFGRKESVRQHETVTHLGRARRDDRLWRGLPIAPEESGGVRVAASATWRSDAGLFAAGRVGAASHEPVMRREPNEEILAWLIMPTTDTPTCLRWRRDFDTHVDAHAAESWFLAEQRLMQVSRGYPRDGAAVVIGDTAADFALALAYDRILGRGIWLTPAQLADDEVFDRHIRTAMGTLISQLTESGQYLAVASASCTNLQLHTAVARLREPRYEFERLSRRRDQIEERGTVQVRFAQMEGGHSEYVVDEHIGVTVVQPMEVLADGTCQAMTGLDSPIPTDLLYPNDLSKLPYWYVDVSLSNDKAPRARGLPSSSLMTLTAGSYPEVNLRASKIGVTYNPSSMGFVAGGTLLPGRIGRPRLRSLSVRAWVEAMAGPVGLGVRLSMPGRQAELLRRRLGSRERLVDLVASPARGLLREFVPRDRAPKQRDPDVIVIGLDPFLSLNGMRGSVAGAEEEVTRLVDELASARLLRRGLVLGCEECGRPSFIDADRLGQRYECPQCATTNTLTSARWRVGSEPTWFYDLHATFRELLKSNGDVPLLAAARLRANARRYEDSAELEFFELTSGKSVAEIDVIASVDDKVVLVEAKVNGEFTARTRAGQTGKLLRVAEALRADRIVLATTRETWKPSDVEHVTQAAAQMSPFAIQAEVMTALGS